MVCTTQATSMTGSKNLQLKLMETLRINSYPDFPILAPKIHWVRHKLACGKVFIQAIMIALLLQSCDAATDEGTGEDGHRIDIIGDGSLKEIWYTINGNLVGKWDLEEKNTGEGIKIYGGTIAVVSRMQGMSISSKMRAAYFTQSSATKYIIEAAGGYHMHIGHRLKAYKGTHYRHWRRLTYKEQTGIDAINCAMEDYAAAKRSLNDLTFKAFLLTSDCYGIPLEYNRPLPLIDMCQDNPRAFWSKKGYAMNEETNGSANFTLQRTVDGNLKHSVPVHIHDFNGETKEEMEKFLDFANMLVLEDTPAKRAEIKELTRGVDALKEHIDSIADLKSTLEEKIRNVDSRRRLARLIREAQKSQSLDKSDA